MGNVPSINWTFANNTKIPIEVFSLYSVKSGIISISDISYDVFEKIKKSNFSNVTARIHVYEEMLILFFEFATETEPNDFEFVHFGLVPTNDFFATLNSNPKIRIKTKEFLFTTECIKKINETLSEFKEKYPDNLLL
ncbi:MAG: hypothetical protein HKP34_04255 [Nitrosopumilus sp.]|nr:hypothetical protein [Nitrosopumilus sp.]